MTLKMCIHTFQQFYVSCLVYFIDAIVYHHNCDVDDDNDADADDSYFIFTSSFFFWGGGGGAEGGGQIPVVFSRGKLASLDRRLIP